MATVKKAAKPMDRGAKLAALRNKIKNTDIGGSGVGFWSPKEGANVIRILPEVGEMQFFFQTVGRHYMPPDGKKNFYCPQFTSEGEHPCPACEIVDDLYKQGDDASKKLAGELRVRKQYWMNIIDRSNEKAGPLIYTPGQKVFGSIVALVQDPDYGDIMYIESGLDITINRSGKGLETEYEVMPRRHESPLSADDATAQEWLSKAKDLSYAVLSDDPDEDKTLSAGKHVYFMPYDRIVSEFDLDGEAVLGEEDEEVEEDEEEVDEDEDEEEEVEEAPVRRSARPAPAARTARRSTRR